MAATAKGITKHHKVPLEQVASFKSKKNADSYVHKLRKDGIKTVLKKSRVNGEPVYRVYAKKGAVPRSSGSEKREIAYRYPSRQMKDAERPQPELKQQSPSPETTEAEATEENEETQDIQSETAAEGEKDDSGKLILAEAGTPEAQSQAAPEQVRDNIVPEASPVQQKSSPEMVVAPAAVSSAVSVSAAEPAAAPARTPNPKETEVGRFATRKEAEDFAAKLKEGGHDSVIRDESTPEKAIFKVYVLLETATPAAPTVTAPGLKAAEQTRTQPETKDENVSEAFERKRKILRGSLGLTGIWTDNGGYSESGKKSGYALILSPQVGVLFSRQGEPLEFEGNANRAPGGLDVGRLKPDILSRFYAHAFYSANIPVLTKNMPGGNTITHDVNGRVVYYIGRGFNLDVMDHFSKAFETREKTIAVAPGSAGFFTSNLFNAILNYETTNRLTLKLEYANFLLSYGDSALTFSDRTDNSFSGYLYYRLASKTSAFVQYTYTDIAYEDHSRDSREHLVYGGLQWAMTGKTVAVLKAGYGIKKFDADGRYGNLIYEAQLRHRFSPKRSLGLTVFRKTNETDIQNAMYIVATGIRADYLQLFTPKFSGGISLAYLHDRYRGLIADPNDGFETTTYQATATLSYAFSRWLRSDVGYTFSKRESSVAPYSFTSNTTFFRLLGSL